MFLDWLGLRFHPEFTKLLCQPLACIYIMFWSANKQDGILTNSDTQGREGDTNAHTDEKDKQREARRID